MQEVMSQSMPITLVYPTEQASTKLQRGPFEIEVALNAPPSPPRTGALRHLIVMSHGSGGSALTDFTLAATLARAGFVVAQPQHRGDNFRDFSKAGPDSWQTRPAEISETIDLVAQDARWDKQLDLHHVGVHGMSAGGVSALVMAGAQWRMLDLIRHCAQHADEDEGFCMYGLANAPLKKAVRRARFAAGAATPEFLLPEALKTLHGRRGRSPSAADPRPDPRVVAVSAVVPVGAIFTPESLTRIRIPVGLTTAGQDQVLLPEFHADKLLNHCARCILLSANPQAGHFDWLFPWPEDVARRVAATQMRGGEVQPDFTAAQRQSAFDRIADFFKANLEP